MIKLFWNTHNQKRTITNDNNIKNKVLREALKKRVDNAPTNVKQDFVKEVFLIKVQIIQFLENYINHLGI